MHSAVTYYLTIIQSNDKICVFVITFINESLCAPRNEHSFRSEQTLKAVSGVIFSISISFDLSAHIHFQLGIKYPVPPEAYHGSRGIH